MRAQPNEGTNQVGVRRFQKQHDRVLPFREGACQPPSKAPCERGVPGPTNGNVRLTSVSYKKNGYH